MLPYAFQTMIALSLPAVFAVLFVLGAVGMIALWKRGKTIEAMSLLNTILLITILLILLLR
jgi:hypothetical protein